MIDVRDVAAVHTRAMVAGRGPHRYVCGGPMVEFNDMIAAVEAGLGRPIRRFPVTPAMFRAAGRLADLAGRFLPIDTGFSYEAAWLLTEGTPTDDTTTLADLDLSWRSPTEAITASLRG